MPLVEFEPTIPVFGRDITFQALDPAATVIACSRSVYSYLNCLISYTVNKVIIYC
jgi:hypothetical protein